MENKIQNKLRGAGVALITPFTVNGEIDKNALANLVETLISDGINYIVALGTTSEAATLSSEERKMVVDIVINQNQGRVPIVVGIGGNNTQEVVNTLKSFDYAGVDAVLSVTPYYTRPQQEGLYLHFKAVAEASKVPVVLYNVPARTAVNLKPETTLRLAHECPNIIGIKEASGIENQIMKIILHKPDGFMVISGDDAITMSMIAAGADGVISVVGNAFPKLFAKMVKCSLLGDFMAARPLHYQLLEFIQLCFKDGSPSGVKSIMAHQGKIKNILRLPLVPVNTAVELEIKEKIDNLKK